MKYLLLIFALGCTKGIETYSVKINMKFGDQQSFCSGSYIGNGLFLTARHCCKDATFDNIEYKDDTYPVLKSHVSQVADLCVVKSKGVAMRKAYIPRNSKDIPFEVWIYGNSGGDCNNNSCNSKSYGQIVGYHYDFFFKRVMYICTATVLPGNSGSGVFNTNDELIAVVSGYGTSGAYLVRLEDVNDFLDNLPEDFK